MYLAGERSSCDRAAGWVTPVRSVVTGLALMTAALLQTALFPQLTIAGFRPDLLLLLTAAYGLRAGPVTGTAVGFVAGLLNDLLLVQPAVGLSAVVLVLVGYAVGLARPYLAVGSVTVPVAVAFATGFVATAGYGLLSRLLGIGGYALELVGEASILVALYNSLLAPPVFTLVGWLVERFPTERLGHL